MTPTEAGFIAYRNYQAYLAGLPESFCGNLSTYTLIIGSIQPKTLTETQQRVRSLGIKLIQIDRQILIGQLKSSEQSQWKQILSEHITRQFQRCYEGEHVSNFEVRLRGEEISKCRLWLTCIERENNPLNEIEEESYPVSEKTEMLLEELAAHLASEKTEMEELEAHETKKIPKKKNRRIRKLEKNLSLASQIEALSTLFFKCCLHQDFISKNAAAILESRVKWFKQSSFYGGIPFEKVFLARIGNEYMIASQSINCSLRNSYIQEIRQNIYHLKDWVSRYYPEFSGEKTPKDLLILMEKIIKSSGKDSEQLTILGDALLDFLHEANNAPSEP